MAQLTLSYDINDFYQVVTDLLTSLWPIIAAAFGILLAGLLLGIIASTFKRFIEDRRG